MKQHPPTALIPSSTPALLPFDLRDEAERRGTRILSTFFADCKSPHTRRAYAEDFRVFRRFLATAYKTPLSPAQVIDRFLFGGERHGDRSNAGHAYEVATWFRAWMADQGKSNGTINRRLAFLRGLVRTGRRLGLLHWTLEVEGVKSRTTRDTRGPGTNAVGQILARLERNASAIARRDAAIIRLLFDTALRRGEVAGLNLTDLDVAGKRLYVRGKGGRDEWITLPGPTLDAIGVWLAVRGEAGGPLFTLFRRNGPTRNRLTGVAVYRMVKVHGLKIGVRTRPHGLRHSGITAACLHAAEQRIPIEEVLRYSRHAHLDTLMKYRDETTNRQGELAAAVAATTPAPSASRRRDYQPPAPNRAAFEKELARLKREQ